MAEDEKMQVSRVAIVTFCLFLATDESHRERGLVKRCIIIEKGTGSDTSRFHNT